MTATARPALQPRPLLALSAIAACALVGLLALEYHSAMNRETRLSLAANLQSSASPAASLASSREAAAVTPDAGRVQGWTQVILARPLFSPSRRPSETAAAGPVQMRLAGIIVGPDGRQAIFAGTHDQRGIVATVGQQAGTWRVVAIDDDDVHVIGPDGPRVLRPSRDDAARAEAAGSSLQSAHPSLLDLLRGRPPQLGIPGLTPGTAPPGSR